MGQVITVAQQKGGSGKTTIAVNLAVALRRDGHSVAVLDTDPQGSLGRWFMARREAGMEDMDFATASAWGVSYECDKLKKHVDFVILDTPPKVDSDLRPALRESDIVIIPVASSQVDVWATEGILDLAARTGCATRIVLNRAKAGTRVLGEVREALNELDAEVSEAVLGNRVAYAESLGIGKGALEMGKGAWTDEIAALKADILAALED